MVQLNALSTINVVYDKLYSVIFIQCLYITLLLASGVEAMLRCIALC